MLLASFVAILIYMDDVIIISDDSLRISELKSSSSQPIPHQRPWTLAMKWLALPKALLSLNKTTIWAIHIAVNPVFHERKKGWVVFLFVAFKLLIFFSNISTCWHLYQSSSKGPIPFTSQQVGHYKFTCSNFNYYLSILGHIFNIISVYPCVSLVILLSLICLLILLQGSC
jgi:hypothetical protein